MTGQIRLMPDDDELQAELLAFGLTDRIVNILINEKDKPEGKIRLVWVRKLITEYGFPSNQLDINVPAGVGRDAGKRDTPVKADVVVYRDVGKTQPFAIVETKAPKKKEGLAQAESYSRNLGGEFHLWSDGNYAFAFKTARYANLSEPIADLPRWVGDKPIAQKVPKTQVLPPFKDENELRQIIGQCHELILEKQGHDPAKAFDEMAKLLFLKLYDEREVPNYYEFAVLLEEKPRDVAKRLRDLFSKSVWSSKYKDVFFSKFTLTPDVTLDLDDFTIFRVVQLLQGYSLLNTTENIQGGDIKGTVYEHMVGRTFRGELAQFFTPREIVEFIVDVIHPTKDDKTYDPACGSGGFLIMAIRKVKNEIKAEFPNLSESDLLAQVKHYAEHNIFGTDINDRMIRVAKMNMIMHGDGHSGIFNTNGLLTDPDIPPAVLSQLRDFDVILSNPPFAGREKDPKILKQFELGMNEEEKPISVSKEVLFIENIIKLLKPGGRAGLVLPAGIFNNPSMTQVRNYIKKHSKITALIGLPHLSFQVAGANNEGHLLFIEKVEKVPEDYSIFVDWANNVGIDAIGRIIEKNDLRDIAKRFPLQSPPRKNVIKFSQLKDRIDPWYYHPNLAKLEQALRKAGNPWVLLGDIFKPSDDLFDPKKCAVDAILRYIEKGDVDLEKGVIGSFSEHTPKTIPGRATFILKEGDILFPDSYDSMRGVVIVPKEYDGYIGTSRFFVLRHNPERVCLDYVPRHFSKPEILALVKHECSGEINPGIAWPAFSQIQVPLPSVPEQERILEEIRKTEIKKQLISRALAEINAAVEDRIREGLPKVIQNYQDIKIKRAEFIGEAELEESK